MPTFDTPEPISVAVELGVGDVHVEAGDRTDTVVDVRPGDAAKKSDITAAEQTRVDLVNGRLSITAPRGARKRYTPWGGRESVDVSIALPAGSHLRVDAAVAGVRCRGALGECRLHTQMGDVQVEQSGSLEVHTGFGDVNVGRAGGSLDVVTGSGHVEIDAVDGEAVIKNSNGATRIGEVAGALQVKAANGDIDVERAHGAVGARTANGSVRLGEVASGEVVAQTAAGTVEIGVRDGVAVWLDLSTGYGNVQSDLDDADRPVPGERTVEVRARTSYGDVTVRRAHPHVTGRVRS